MIGKTPPIPVWAAALLALLTLGCRQDMQDQPKYEPYELSEQFANGIVNQNPPAGTVARGFLKDDTHYWLGRDISGRLVSELPERLTWSGALLERGAERYGIYCSPCHDLSGGGRGMIVQRGFKQPEPLWEDRLWEMPLGYFYDVGTNGFGIMPSYKIQVPEDDRWAIAAYIRVLQISQGRTLEQLDLVQPGLSAELRLEIEAAAAAVEPVEPEPGADSHSDSDHG
ncbi:MAG: cytochrome c [Acidobacteriota bacterium]